MPFDFTGDNDSDDVSTIPGRDRPEVIDYDYEDNVEKLQAAYLKYLGRQATDEEINGWVSGRSGGGIDAWVNAIRNSEQAKNYQKQTEQRDSLNASRSQTPQPDPTPSTRTSRQREPMAIPTDFTGDPREDDPETAPPPPPPSRPPNRARPPETVAYGVVASQGGNSYYTASQQIQDAYRQYLDRDASPDEISKQLSGGRYFAPKNVQHAIDNIRASKEAREYRMGQAAAEKKTQNWPAGAETTMKGTGNGTTTETGVPARTGQAPPGWDQGRWSDPNFHHVKYDVAAFLYGVTAPSEVRSIVQSARFQARFPGATFDGENTIDFGPTLREHYEDGGDLVGSVSVIRGADQGGDTSGGLHWSPVGAPGAGEGNRGQDPAMAPESVGSEVVGPPGWNPPPGSPLINPTLTPGPVGMNYPAGPGGLTYRSETDPTGPGSGGGTMGSMITPYNPLETYSPVPYTPPPPFQPPAYEGATPFAQDPYVAADPFTGPTAADMAADPGYQFRLQQGQEALERSGAARGVTNTGGTLRDILDYGQQAAAQEYGNVFGRQRDVYDLNERNRFNAYQSNYGNAMDAYNVNERNRAGAFDRNVGTARDAYAMNEENRYRGYTTNELARLQQNQEAENRRSGAYGTNLGAYERQQQYGLRAQGQGFDQAFRNWQQQYYQGRQNAQDTYNRMYGLSTT